MGSYPVRGCLKYPVLLLGLLCLASNTVFAQLNAAFSMDKSGGCSPLVVNFTNTTAGASANAVYKWIFGNGNSSALANGGAVYTDEQTYIVTLTVQDGANQSTSTQQVTVYRPPVVDFTVAPAKVCLGTPVTFASNSSPGSGSIASYTWDFGDGSTMRGTSSNQPYTYAVEQVASVSLTVTNSFGCHTTVSKANVVTIIPALTASFSADKKVLCLVTDPVQFTNSSTGPGTLDYTWDFGDGGTSIQQNPAHTFSKKGTYSIKLTVHSSEGCTVVSTQTNSLNVANYSTSFDVPSPICKGSTVSFTSQSSPTPDNTNWSIDGVQQYYTYGSLSYVFSTIGNHTITLNNTFGTCPQSVTKTISVKDLPYPNGFTADIAGKCGSPVAVNFKDPTPGAVKWAWDYNYIYYNGPQIGSTIQTPTHTYTSDGSYLVWLQVTNADGCSNTISQYVQITRPTVNINAGPGTLSSCTTLLTNTFSTYSSEPLTATKWNFGDGSTSTDPSPTHTFKNTGNYTVTLNYTTQNGCMGTVVFTQFAIFPPPPVAVTINPTNPASCLTPITVTLGAYSSDPLAATNWTFGDGGASADPSPTHTYTTIGHYAATLNYTTQAGCKGTVYSSPIIIDPKIKLDFSLTPNPVCGNNTVYFATTGNNPDINTYNWDFGDGGTSYSIVANPTYAYNAAGTYTIKLYVKNIGGCDTSMTKTITVKPPFPQIIGHTNTCDGTRGEVTFTQASVQATTISWNFGDGSTVTTPGDQATVKHTYKKTGIYTVTLTATNGQCSLVATDPNPIHVLLKQAPYLTGSASAVCSNTPVAIQMAKLDENPYQSNDIYYGYYYAGYYFQSTQYRDGTAFQGNRSDNGYQYRWTTTYNGALSNFQTGEKDIRFILTSYVFGCQDTTNYMPLAIKGATGGFAVIADKLCYQSPVLLQDTSHSTPDNPILSWQWNFGDGQSVTKTKGGAISHTYASPGGYTVSMQITDAAGCSANAPYTQYVSFNGPQAAFSASGTDVHLNTTVYFNNYTNDYGNSNTVYSWDFGDGSTSTDVYPSHTYTKPGTYTVTMTASNPSLPCQSTATPAVIIVRNFNSAFSFASSYVAGSCPPLLVSFVNTSYNYIRVSWDFGDGITADNVNYPSHVYEKPGKYIVTLNVYAYNGIQGIYIDSILISAPMVSLPPAPPPTCIGNTVVLSSTVTNGGSFSWDFGDGSIVPAANGTARHQYLTAGTYKATLLLQNDAGCIKDTTLPGAVTIRPNPVATISPADPVICLNNSVLLQASGGSGYEWSPATGLSDNTIADPVASPKVSTDYVLTVKDDIGCQNTAPLTVKVVQPGNLQVSPDATVCAGESVQLTATGETIYQWINNTEGLSGTGIPNPVALAPVTTTYIVKGSDAYSCFVDEAAVTVTVRPLPTVNAGPDVLVRAGYDVTLDATGSSDVTEWKWVPERYLSCYDCPSPLCTPLASTNYFLTAKNQYGCKASDTIFVAVDCEESHVRVPNAFTPNNDGVNDVFVVKGISIIKHMVIYDRWGEKVYERNDFIAGDRASCWDGRFRGQPCPSGAYVYFIEMECPSGGVFSRKGSFVLIR